MINMDKDFIVGLVYTRFDEKFGPNAWLWEPENLPSELTTIASLKTTALLAGEQGAAPETLAVIPIPSQNLKALVKVITIEDEQFRGGENDTSLILFFKEGADSIFYKYMNNLELFFKDAASKITELMGSGQEVEKIKEDFKQLFLKLINLLNELRDLELKSDEADAFPSIEKEEEEKLRRKYKVIVCGDPAVGKTSVILRYTDKAFRRTYLPTIGVNMSEKRITYENNIVDFVIWDIAGQAKFQKMRKLFYEGANAQIFVFDLTQPETLHNLMKWAEDIENLLQRKIPGIIIGNKIDLVTERKIEGTEIESVSNRLELKWYLTSALTGDNVEETFQILAQKIIDFYKKQLIY